MTCVVVLLSQDLYVQERDRLRALCEQQRSELLLSARTLAETERSQSKEHVDLTRLQGMNRDLTEQLDAEKQTVQRLTDSIADLTYRKDQVRAPIPF